MTVKELKNLLDKYPDDMEIVYTRFSDYGEMTEKDIETIKIFKIEPVEGIDKGSYIMDATFMREDDYRLKLKNTSKESWYNEEYIKYINEQKKNVKTYLHFVGN